MSNAAFIATVAGSLLVIAGVVLIAWRQHTLRVIAEDERDLVTSILVHKEMEDEWSWPERAA